MCIHRPPCATSSTSVRPSPTVFFLAVPSALVWLLSLRRCLCQHGSLWRRVTSRANNIRARESHGFSRLKRPGAAKSVRESSMLYEPRQTIIALIHATMRPFPMRFYCTDGRWYVRRPGRKSPQTTNREIVPRSFNFEVIKQACSDENQFHFLSRRLRVYQLVLRTKRSISCQQTTIRFDGK